MQPRRLLGHKTPRYLWCPRSCTHVLFSRLLSSTSLSAPSSSIYVSNSYNPYFNLVFEDWLFRHKTPKDPLLLVYRDNPCVVIGRNQNPWKEVNLEALRERPDTPFIRRRSGGGTVYHDKGNTNYSIHLPRTSFDRHATGQVVLRAVRSLGIDARLNERNDICVGPHKICSAYKIVNTRAYHHGTMLISTQLDTLGDLLRTNKETMLTRGVASVRSPVCNLQQHQPQVTHESFTQAMINAFREEYAVNEDATYVEETAELLEDEYIRQGMSELPSWNWAFGQTPEFTYTVETTFTWGQVDASIKARHGIIESVKLDISDTLLDQQSAQKVCDQVESTFVNQRYAAVVPVTTDNQVQRDLQSWLCDIMST